MPEILHFNQAPSDAGYRSKCACVFIYAIVVHALQTADCGSLVWESMFIDF